jgi:predicted DsbA family dithiol-disulfide isomerase
VFKHFVVHPQIAMTPALATCAAGMQGKFWEFEHAVWNSAWDIQAGPRMKDPQLLNEDNMVKLATDMKLNVDKFKTDMKGDKCKNDVNGGMTTLSKLGVRGTPAFFINGRYLSGAQPIDAFKSVIDEEIKKADEAIKAGTKPSDYYQTAVVEKGKKTL